MAQNNRIEMAKIGASHGIKGEVKIISYSQDPLALKSYKNLYDSAGHLYVISHLRTSGKALIAKFAGIDDPEEARKLCHKVLYVMREDLSPIKDEDEFYYSDLAGLSAYSLEGVHLGHVCGVFNFGAGDLLEIQFKTAKKEFISFTRDNVPKIDVGAGALFVDCEKAAIMAVLDQVKPQNLG